MMKTKAYALLLAGILLISFAGCENTTQPAEKESDLPTQIIQSADVTSATKTSDDIPAEESELSACRSGNAGYLCNNLCSDSRRKNTGSAAERKSGLAASCTGRTVTTGRNAKTDGVTAVRRTKNRFAPTACTAASTCPTEPAPTEPKPPVDQPSEEPQEPEFNIEYWVSFAKNYAVRIGLELSPDAVECWDNPIIAGAHSKYLERDITNCLNCYKNIEGFTGVWIWAEPDGNGAYKLYIGYE